jgi:hypothetical protein
MYNLIYTIASLATSLGSYTDLPSCQKAMRDHARTQIMGTLPTNPDVEKALDIQLQVTKQYVCLKVDSKSKP